MYDHCSYNLTGWPGSQMGYADTWDRSRASMKKADAFRDKQLYRHVCSN